MSIDLIRLLDSEVRSTTTMASQKGYTVAADMWSLGVLATMLVTGNCILNSTQDTGDDHISATAIVDAAKAGILNSLDCSSLWQRASKQAIAFVK